MGRPGEHRRHYRPPASRSPSININIRGEAWLDLGLIEGRALDNPTPFQRQIIIITSRSIPFVRVPFQANIK
jgi:hypothetical protein